MLDGAEIEEGVADGQDVQRRPRTNPVDRPPIAGKDDQAALTADLEAQHDDSVINPESSLQLRGCSGLSAQSGMRVRSVTG